MGFWGCSCKFQVVANDQDPETYGEKHVTKKTLLSLHFLENIQLRNKKLLIRLFSFSPAL
jgi:hypothetical protein